MVISKNSQLGLMMDDTMLQVELLELMKNDLRHTIDIIDNAVVNDGVATIKVEDNELDMFNVEKLENNRQIDERISLRLADNNDNFIDNKNSKIYLICDGVDKCSKMIRIGDNFSTKALRNIEFGKHTYLLGKDEMCRFLCQKGAIKGIYWCRSKNIAFEFGFDLEDDGYYFDSRYSYEFNKITKIITFVFLGDIDVIMLEKGRNNGKPKIDGKITNTSNFTVYVVDSSWNQLIIRTEGFAVMGHFRLQPCGVNHVDRKLIWINAFEKHGYKRQPKASILHS